MVRPLPADRPGLRHRALFPVVFGIFLTGAGIGLMAGALDDDGGWTKIVPDALEPLLAGLLICAGLASAIPSLLWILLPLRGSRPPVVRFSPDHISIRGSLVPLTFQLARHTITEVYLATFSLPPGFGLGPMVVLKTAKGRGRAVQYLYRGDPADLVRDIAAWASATIGPPRHVRRERSMAPSARRGSA